MTTYRKQPAAPAPTAANRKAASRKAAPIIMGLCLLLAVVVVLFAPIMVGGAQTTQTSAAVSAAPSQVAVYAAAAPAADLLDYEPVLPAALPEGVSVVAYSVLDNGALEVEYRVGKATVVYRTAPGNDDLTGNYTEYAYTAYETVEGISRCYEGPSEKKLALAFWAADGYSYALVAADGVEADTLRELAEAIG